MPEAWLDRRGTVESRTAAAPLAVALHPGPGLWVVATPPRAGPAGGPRVTRGGFCSSHSRLLLSAEGVPRGLKILHDCTSREGAYTATRLVLSRGITADCTRSLIYSHTDSPHDSPTQLET